MEISKRLKDRSAIVCVVGVGYVGFPLAEAFSKHLKVIGYDLNGKKVGELNNKNNNSNLKFTSNPAEIKKADFILIAVPTPVTESKEPDLFCVKSSVETVGHNLKKGAVVVLESTVYPGVTKDIVKPILEKSSGMKCGVDFKIGYSPERINPGDDAHGIGNELALIFERMNIDIMDVIEAASTKWNFNVYYPGAGVGGHCLPVDPYYLVAKAEELGYHSKVITAGRAVNDYMPLHVFELGEPRWLGSCV